MINILFIGDINGRPGRNAVKQLVPNLNSEKKIDFVIANGENSAGGFGITKDVFDDLMAARINCVTMGNHIWDKKDSMGLIDSEKRIIKPANMPPGTPGNPYGIFSIDKNGIEVKIGVINLIGRVFMSPMDCPFRTADKIADEIRKTTNIIFVDMHAEATSEKMALGHYLDGKVTAVVGTHTHVQTSDERVLAGGTGYMTDAGMTGSFDSVIGIKKEIIIKKFLTGIPDKYEVAELDVHFNGVICTSDEISGKTIRLERLDIKYEKS